MRAECIDLDDIAYWEENVTLGVDMEPDYLFEDSDGGKHLINPGVQNVCFFGPTCVPVLPPLTAHSTLHPLLQHLLKKYEVALSSNNGYDRFEHILGYNNVRQY